MNRKSATIFAALALALAGANDARSAAFDGSGIELSRPFIDGAGDVCTTIENTTAGPITVDLEYVRAPRGTLLSGIAGVLTIETQCIPGVTVAAGVTTAPICFTPTDSGSFCNGFVTHVPDGVCGGAEFSCRALSTLRIPPMSPTGSFTVTVGSNAPAGATSISTNVTAVSVPAGFILTIPSSIPIPTTPNTGTFDIVIDFAPLPSADAEWNVEFTFDTEDNFFAEYSVIGDAPAPVPALGRYGFAVLVLFLVSGFFLLLRRRSFQRLGSV